MELRHYLEILWGRKWVIVITVSVTMLVVLLGTFLATPRYQATTRIRVATASAGSVTYADYQYADRLLNTYAEIIASQPILDELGSVLEVREVPEVIVEIVPNTELIEITVEDSDPKLAVTAADTLADILVSQSTELYSGGGKSPQEILGEQLTQIEAELSQAREEYDLVVSESPEDSSRIEAAAQSIELKQRAYALFLEQYEEARIREAVRAHTISVVERAELPETPSSPRVLLNVSLGVFVGLAGGIGLAFLFENQDKTLYTTEQIEALTTEPSLGYIPAFKIKKGSSVFDDSPHEETFRRLCTQIKLSTDKLPHQALLLTSAGVGEGKSMIVANLAITFARSGKAVIVVDTDLRRPRLHTYLNVSNDQGLSNVLSQQTELGEVLQNSLVPGLQILTSGPLVRKPGSLLESAMMGSITNELKRRANYVLLDTPSFLAVSDAALISPHVDGVILVISRGLTRERELFDVQRQLASIRANVIGVVINRAGQDGSYAYFQ